jgi:hypothetical protein
MFLIFLTLHYWSQHIHRQKFSYIHLASKNVFWLPHYYLLFFVFYFILKGQFLIFGLSLHPKWHDKLFFRFIIHKISLFVLIFTFFFYQSHRSNERSVKIFFIIGVSFRHEKLLSFPRNFRSNIGMNRLVDYHFVLRQDTQKFNVYIKGNPKIIKVR